MSERKIKFRAYNKLLKKWVCFTVVEIADLIDSIHYYKNWIQYTGL